MRFSLPNKHIGQLPTVLFQFPLSSEAKAASELQLQYLSSPFDFPIVFSLTLLLELTATGPDQEKQQEKN